MRLVSLGRSEEANCYERRVLTLGEEAKKRDKAYVELYE